MSAEWPDDGHMQGHGLQGHRWQVHRGAQAPHLRAVTRGLSRLGLDWPRTVLSWMCRSYPGSP